MAFEPSKMTSFFDAVVSIGRFVEGLRQIQPPSVPAGGYGSTNERLEALEQFAQDMAVAFGQIRDLEFAVLDISRETLDDAMYQIELELMRTRTVEVVGAQEVQVEPHLKIVLPTPQEPDDGAVIPPHPCLPCYAEMTSGSAGDASTTCDFLYSVYAMDQTTLLAKNSAGDDATGIKPKKERLVHTKYTTPSGKNLALHFYDDDGDLHLWDANELPFEPEAC